MIQQKIKNNTNKAARLTDFNMEEMKKENKATSNIILIKDWRKQCRHIQKTKDKGIKKKGNLGRKKQFK